MHREERTIAQAVHDQVVGLPEHLQLVVLSLVPLPHALLHLPPPFHAPVLRAHHPSTDTHRTLTILRLPPPALQAAIDALPLLPPLTNLSFADAIFPRAPAISFTTLTALTALTALDVSGAALSGVAVDALSVALAALPSLCALDATDNHLPQRAMEALMRAVARYTTLRSLRLLRTVPSTAEDCCALRTLAAAVPAMRALSDVAVGGIGHVSVDRGVGHHLVGGLSAILDTLSDCAARESLELRFKADLLKKHAHTFSSALGTLTALRRLARTVPDVILFDPIIDMQLGLQADAEMDTACVVATGLSRLVGLTELDINLRTNVPHASQAADLLRSLRPLTALARLAVAHTRSWVCAAAVAGAHARSPRGHSAAAPAGLRELRVDANGSALQERLVGPAVLAACALLHRDVTKSRF